METGALLNVRETARMLGVHENTIRNWAERGVLRPIRLPASGYRRFRLEEVERLQREMLSDLAPADTGPVVKKGFKSATILHGDQV